MEALLSEVVASGTEPKWPRHLGDLVYAEMKRRGMSQLEVGQHFGISQSSIARWIDGTSNPKGKRVAEVAKFCGVETAVAYRLCYRMPDTAADAAALSCRVNDLEQHVSDLGNEIRELRAQARLMNEALATLLDRVQTARARNIKNV